LLPKNNGLGVMISAFQSDEFGWGVDISKDTLQEINKQRMGKMNFDVEAAKAVQDNVYKLDLMEDPLVRLFEFGGGNGYWSGNHIIIQIEDVMDCLKHLHGDQYKYCFLFDHSSGHAKKRENGLDAKKMNVSWGGNMSMRNTHIESYHGFIGPYHDSSIEGMVTVGAEQTLTYESESDLRLGPFHISESEREAKRHDINFEISTEKQKAKQLTKTELVEKLMETEFGKVEGRVKLRSMKATELRTKAQQLGISVIQIQTHKTIRGWEHAPKGLLQVLWERGFIDPKKWQQYKRRVLDDNNDLVEELSMEHIMANCWDFANEKSQLEFVCEQLGARALFTTKYHAEMAGEGVEYSWAHSKNTYRGVSLSKKKGKTNFTATVKSCIARELLTTELIRKFSRRARAYMLAYKAFELNDHVTREQNAPYLISQDKIEQMMSTFKTHRCAMDFDQTFLIDCVGDAFDKKRKRESNNDCGKNV